MQEQKIKCFDCAGLAGRGRGANAGCRNSLNDKVHVAG